jgi:hypothetical protein
MCVLMLTLLVILGGVVIFLAVRALVIVTVGAVLVPLVLLLSPRTTKTGRYLGAVLLAIEAGLGVYLYHLHH